MVKDLRLGISSGWNSQIATFAVAHLTHRFRVKSLTHGRHTVKADQLDLQRLRQLVYS
jgi:hypothetical protein